MTEISFGTVSKRHEGKIFVQGSMHSKLQIYLSICVNQIFLSPAICCTSP